MAGTDTKQKIINAAGELFATRGLEGTSIREIVKKADAALCSVNYHFESKEQLFVACVRYVIQDRLALDDELSILDDETILSPDDMAALLRRVIHRMYRLILNPENPYWYGILLIRAKHEAHQGVKSVLTAITDPERVKTFLVRNLPDLDEHDAYMWVFNLVAQIQYYVVSKPTVLKTLGKESYDEEMLDRIAGYTTDNLLRTLNLPNP